MEWEAKELIKGVADQQYIEHISGLGIAPQAHQVPENLQRRKVGSQQRFNFLKVPPDPPQPAAKFAATDDLSVEFGDHGPGHGGAQDRIHGREQHQHDCTDQWFSHRFTVALA